MKEELNLEQMLAADREHVQHATRQALAGGLVQRVSAARLTKLESHLGQYLFAGVTAAAVILIGIAVSRSTVDRSLPPVTVARSISAPVMRASPVPPAIQRRTGVSAPPRAIARQRDHKPKIQRTMPFPTPTPLSPEERTLVLIAQSSPQERSIVLAQQQQLNEDFVNGIRQFHEKIQQQKGEPQ